MKIEDAKRLQKEWRKKPCEHPNIDQDVVSGHRSDDWRCLHCGRRVDHDQWLKDRSNNKKKNSK